MMTILVSHVNTVSVHVHGKFLQFHIYMYCFNYSIFSITVKPVLSRHPLLSGNQPQNFANLLPEKHTVKFH